MLTDDQLADHLRTRLRREVATIQPPADLLASLGRRARRSLTLRVTGVTAALAAAAATVLVATTATGGGGAAPSGSAVLTAAMVERVASASRLALAHSGRAKIAYRETDNGVLQVSGTDNIAFAGKNWNDAISQTFPARDGQHWHAQSAIDRIVNGRFYLYTTRRDGRRGWTRDTNPSGHPVMSIPDPRTLFGLLSPSAKFKFIGYVVIGGVRLTELRATRQPGLHAINWLPGVQPGSHLSFLTVLVDKHNIVHRISLRVRLDRTTKPIYFKRFADGRLALLVPTVAYLKEARALAKKMRRHSHVIVRVDRSLPAAVHRHVDVTSATVSFSSFGKKVAITAPRQAVPVYGRG